MGSNGSFLLARIPYSTSSWNLSEQFAPPGRHVVALCRRKEGGDRHPVQGEGAGLVHAEHGGRAQGLDRRHAPGQNLVLRDAPRAEREEDGQHHRELLRQDGHGEGDPRQEALEPVAAGQAVDDHDDRAQGRGRRWRRSGRCPVSLCSRVLRASRSAGPRRSSPSRYAAPSTGPRRSPVPGRPACRRRRTAGRRRRARSACTPPGPGIFPDRDRLSGQERLVDGDAGGGEEDTVGRHAVALGEDDDVAAHHLAPRDAPLLPVADHKRSRAGEVSQRLQRPFGLALLVDA